MQLFWLEGIEEPAGSSDVVPRGLRTEIRIVSTVKVSQMQKQVDDMSRDLRLLEETIQSLNWTTELQE